MSNFTNVHDLNKMFKVEQTQSKNVDWSVMERQMEIIEEEFNELKTAVLRGDWEELKDAVGDVLVTTYGMGYRGNFDCDKLMDNISESNFSKVCRNQEEITMTVDYYTAMGCKVYVEETSLGGEVVWAVKSAEDQSYTDNGEIKKIPRGKFLKNVNWVSPDLNVEL